MAESAHLEIGYATVEVAKSLLHGSEGIVDGCLGRGGQLPECLHDAAHLGVEVGELNLQDPDAFGITCTSGGTRRGRRCREPDMKKGQVRLAAQGGFRGEVTEHRERREAIPDEATDACDGALSSTTVLEFLSGDHQADELQRRPGEREQRRYLCLGHPRGTLSGP